MANLPTTKRITQEELQGSAEQQIETIIRPINLHFEDMYSALNKDLTFQENMDAQITKVRLKVPNAYPVLAEWDDIKFQLEMKRSPSGSRVIHVEDVDDINEVFNNPIWADVKFNDGEATIKYITGLQPCHTYNVTILVI